GRCAGIPPSGRNPHPADRAPGHDRAGHARAGGAARAVVAGCPVPRLRGGRAGSRIRSTQAAGRRARRRQEHGQLLRLLEERCRISDVEGRTRCRPGTTGMSATPARRRLSTSTSLLLTCAALGVAGGLLLAPANWLSTVLLTLGMPVVSVAITGLWILPSVIALRLLRRPPGGLLVGIIAGLVIVPFSGYGFMSVV